jgi:hypothetical protein
MKQLNHYKVLVIIVIIIILLLSSIIIKGIWREAGYEEVECQGLLGDLLNKMKLTCAAELAAEQQILEHAKQQVNTRIQDYYNYCNQLGRTPDDKIISIRDNEKQNYADKLADLEKIINTISTEVSGRLKLINVEINAIEALINNLGEKMMSKEQMRGDEESPELSDARLEMLRKYKSNYEKLKTKRIEEMKNLAIDCKESMNDLLVTTEDIISDDNELHQSFTEFLTSSQWSGSYHSKDLAFMSKKSESLKLEKERRREELSVNGAEIARLWTLLRIPSSEREAFQSSFKMNLSMETLEKGREELQRLREIRTTSLGRVITSIRNDIVALWTEIGIDSDELKQSEFPLFFAEIGTLQDESVDIHESYFTLLKARVDELRPILSKVSKREVVVQERIELEHLSLNSERLNARGPNARKEREREEGMTVRVRNLEKLTKELTTSIQAWEKNNGPFTYMGERYLNRITKQDELYAEIRDSLRMARKKKDGKLDNVATKNVPPARKNSTGGVTLSSSSSSALSNISNTMKKQQEQQQLEKVATVPLTESNLLNLDSENNFCNRISTGSNETDITTATEIRDPTRI